MTITAIAPPTATETFSVIYRVDAYVSVQVEREAGTDADDVIASITREELANGEECEGLWDGLKDAWRTGDVARVTNEDGDDLL